MDSSIRTYSTLKHAVTIGLAVLKTGDSSGTTSTTVGAGENYKVQGTLNDPLTGTLKDKTITFTASDPIKISGKITNTNGFYSGSQAAPGTQAHIIFRVNLLVMTFTTVKIPRQEH